MLKARFEGTARWKRRCSVWALTHWEPLIEILMSLVVSLGGDRSSSVQHWPTPGDSSSTAPCRALSRNECTLGTVKKFNNVHGAQGPHTRMDAGTSQEMVFHEAACLPQVRSQKSEATVPNIYPFLTFLLCPHWVIPTQASQHLRFAAERSWSEKFRDNENVAHCKLYFCSKINMHSPWVPEEKVCTELSDT